MLDNVITYIIIIILTPGGWGNRDWHTDVVMYNSEEDTWTTVGQMAQKRSIFGVSLVPSNTVDFCL